LLRKIFTSLSVSVSGLCILYHNFVAYILVIALLDSPVSGMYSSSYTDMGYHIWRRGLISSPQPRRRRRRKDNPVSGGISGLPCSWGM
jgi:hypothetical protein